MKGGAVVIEWCPAFGPKAAAHLWSHPDKNGVVECLFCRARKVKEMNEAAKEGDAK